VRTGDPFGRTPRGGVDVDLPQRGGTTTTAPGGGGGGGGGGELALVDSSFTCSELCSSWKVFAADGQAFIQLGGSDRADYAWTVPQTIDPSGTRLSWGGKSSGNASIDIRPIGEGGIVFDEPDPGARAATGRGEVAKTGTITVTGTPGEVKLIYSFGFSIAVTHVYRR
jgi:hypothetical protein